MSSVLLREPAPRIDPGPPGGERPPGGGLAAFLAVLWRQRTLLLVALVVVVAGLIVGWQVAPRDYEARTTLTWTGDPEVQVDGNDIAAIGGDLVRTASSRRVLADVVQQLGVDRSVPDLRDDVDARFLVATSQVSITVRDGDEDVARAVARELCARLPAYGDTLGIAGFRPATSVSVVPHEDPATWVGSVLWVLLAGLLVAWLASWRDARTNTVSDAAEVEAALTAPVLAHMRMPRDPTVLPALTPGAASAHPFRHVRTALRLVGRRAQHVVGDPEPADPSSYDDALDTPATARLVVSASPVVGPAAVWVATNLALALVQDGWRVLLLDGRLGSRFGRPKPGEPAGPGLLDVLDGIPLADAVHPGPVDGLSVVTAGTRGEDLDALTVERFADVVEQAHRLVDVVVVVAPPLEVCDDALVMATPGTLLLSVPEGRVSPAMLRAQGARVRASVPRLLGSVLVGRLSERASL